MKYLYKLSALLLLVFIINSCSKGGSSGPCGDVSGVTISQNKDVLNLSFTPSSTSSISYEVSYQIQNPSMNPDYGQKVTVKQANNTLNIGELSLAPGSTYSFYVRAICDEGPGEWIGPKAITIDNFCDRPGGLTVSYIGTKAACQWLMNPDTRATSFQVQYGAQGFSLGSGTVETVNASPYDGAAMMPNKSYDFYVRSYCNNSLGWGEWVGPYTFHATYYQNVCLQPSNISWTVEFSGGTPVGARFSYDGKGGDSFEYTAVLRGQSVTSGNPSTISSGYVPVVLVPRNVDYDFYIRTICNDGSKTAWAGPVPFIVN